MTRHRFVPLALITALTVIAGCSGSVSIGQPFPISGDSVIAANIRSCLPAAGRIKVEVDVTAGAQPGYVLISISDDATPFERFLQSHLGTTDYHYEVTGAVQHAAGACVVVQLDLNEAAPGQPDWRASSKSLHYTISLVP